MKIVYSEKCKSLVLEHNEIIVTTETDFLSQNMFYQWVDSIEYMHKHDDEGNIFYVTNVGNVMMPFQIEFVDFNMKPNETAHEGFDSLDAAINYLHNTPDEILKNWIYPID